MTPSMAEQLLRYNPATGQLTWRQNNGKGSKAQPGKPAGYVLRGYNHVYLENRAWRATHLIWQIVKRRRPIMEIDHINGIKNDDRWVNLRECTRTNNMRNQPVHKNNKLGIKGVNERCGKFQARIRVDKKLLYLGTFDTAAQAAAAYQAAAAKYFGAFAR